MKTIHYSFICLLVLLSSVRVNAQDCNCFESNYDITPQGAFFWQTAWFSYYGLDREEDKGENEIQFSAENINSMIESYLFYPDNAKPKGFRLYYGLNSLRDTIPMLVMVPIDTFCNDLFSIVEDQQALVSTGEAEYFCSKDSAAFFTGNWQTYDTINKKIETYINGYNYQLDVIENLLTPDEDGNAGLTFEFGLRTISPQEVCFETQEGNYGSIIYCNLVYGVTSNTMNWDDRLDFAMPCPKMCDSNGSPLTNH